MSRAKNINIRVRKNETTYSCSFCPSGSVTSQDAMPLRLGGDDGVRIIKTLGLAGNEACCPSCRGLIIRIIEMIEKTSRGK